MADEHAQTPLTWAALLAHWTDIARSALALTHDEDGQRWRSVVPDVIALQAVTFATRDLDRLETSERALGLDRAEVLVRKHATNIHTAWKGLDIPPALGELIEQARGSIAEALSSGSEWLVQSGPLRLSDPRPLLSALVDLGFTGDLYLAIPSAVLAHGTPVAFVHPPKGGPPPPAVTLAVSAFLQHHGAITGPLRQPMFRQVYRQPLERGRVRDFVAPFDATLPAGRPMLALVLTDGGPRALPPAPPVGDAEPNEVIFAEDPPPG